MTAETMPPHLYKPNDVRWRRGDVVIHDADSKEPHMLMRVVGFTRDRQLVKTQYIDTRHKRKVYKNPMAYLHDPNRFGLVRDPWSQIYLEKYQQEFEAMRWWNRTYRPGLWIKTMSADGDGKVCRVNAEAFMQGMSAYVHLEKGGNWLLRFVVAVPDPDTYPNITIEHTALAEGIKPMNETPGINLGVIEDMESTLLPDNHTVKARGVWLMDGDKPELFYEASALAGVQHELSCLKDAICALSDVGMLFDGMDECNEYTHEENNKVMESALDRIYGLVSGRGEK